MGPEDTIRRLLGPLAARAAAWELVSIEPGPRSVELEFGRGDARFTVRLFPADENEGYYRRTRHFKIGYAGAEADGDRISLLDDVFRVVARGESSLSDAERASFFQGTMRREQVAEVRGDTLVLRLTARLRASNTPGKAAEPVAPDPDPAVIESAIRSARAAGADRVLLTGGEPTLDPRLPQWVRLAREEGLGVTVQTDGVLAGAPGFFDAFAGALPNVLHVRFDGVPVGPGRPDAEGAAKEEAIRAALAHGVDVVLAAPGLGPDERRSLARWALRAFDGRVKVEYA